MQRHKLTGGSYCFRVRLCFGMRVNIIKKCGEEPVFVVIVRCVASICGRLTWYCTCCVGYVNNIVRDLRGLEALAELSMRMRGAERRPSEVDVEKGP